MAQFGSLSRWERGRVRVVPDKGATLTRRCAAALSQKERAGMALRAGWVLAYAGRAVMGVGSRFGAGCIRVHGRWRCGGAVRRRRDFA